MFTKRRNSALTFMVIVLFLVFLNVQSVSPEWSDDKPLVTLLSVDDASSIIQTSDHKIWIVWQKQVESGGVIYYSTSSDYGATWSAEKNLTSMPDSHADATVDPYITQLSNGTIWVVWAVKKQPFPSDFTLTAAPASLTIPVNGSDTSNITISSLYSFNDPVNLTVRSIMPPFTHNITTSFNPPQVTPPPNGEANSTLTIDVGNGTSPDDYNIVVQGHCERLGITHTVTIIVTVPVTAGSSASATQDTADTPPSTSSESPSAENYDLYYKTSDDNGTSWSNEEKIPLTESSADDLGPSIIQASDGTIWLFWSSSRTGYHEIFYKNSSDFGASWSDDIRLTYNASHDARPAIAQMQDGRMWVAWHSQRYYSEGKNEEILYKIYNGSWSDNYRLTNHTNMDITPAILQLSNGTIRVFWASSPLSEVELFDVYYTESHDNGENWSDRIQFTTHVHEDNCPAVTQSVDDRIWVTWTTNRTGNWDIYYRTSLVHSIALTDIIPSPTQVYQEENVTIDVTVQNYGDYNETFTVNCYANSTPVGTQDVNLSSRASTIVTFKWNTSGFTRANYCIKVNTSSVDGEAYIGDNTRTHEHVRVKLLGDVDDNGVVEISDLYALGVAYNSVPGSPNWNEEADMNGDNSVTAIDLSALVRNYGKIG